MTDVIQAEDSDWLSDFSAKKETKKDSKKSEWMTFDHPGEYKIRLVGKGVKFLKYFKPFGKGSRVITHKSLKDEDPAWQAGHYPADTFAIHVIDRADGKLKIMEKGRGLFKHFADYEQVNEINPASKSAPDFVIKVEWPNGDKKQAKYTATAKAMPSPFTDEEIAMIKENWAPLKTIYQTTPIEKIKELWEALPEAAKVVPKKGEKTTTESASSTPKVQPKIVEPKKPVEVEEAKSTKDDSSTNVDEDLFGDEKSESLF